MFALSWNLLFALLQFDWLCSISILSVNLVLPNDVLLNSSEFGVTGGITENSVQVVELQVLQVHLGDAMKTHYGQDLGQRCGCGRPLVEGQGRGP